MNQLLFNEFIKICRDLNQVNIKPTLMGSLGLELVSKKDWNPSDIDLHVHGDPRGWEAPDEERIYHFDAIQSVMNRLDYRLIDRHEHEFSNGTTSVEYGCIDTLPEFANVQLSDLQHMSIEGAEFYVPSLEQFLKIYESSSQDSYRNENNNNKDFKKIAYLENVLSKR